jgi:hypothetical protein
MGEGIGSTCHLDLLGKVLTRMRNYVMEELVYTIYNVFYDATVCVCLPTSLVLNFWTMLESWITTGVPRSHVRMP